MKRIKICNHLEKRLVDQFTKVPEVSPICQFPHAEPEPDRIPIWYCLHCGRSGCSRYSRNRCMEVHNKSERHNMCVNVEEGAVWCYACDEELHELVNENIGQEALSKQVKEFADKVEQIDFRCLKLKRKNSFPAPVINDQMKPSQLLTLPQAISSVKDSIFGLKNLGNTCFFNSVLQVLMASETFIERLRQAAKIVNSSSMAGEILALVDAHHESVRNPRLVFLKLISQKKMFGYFHQQDSHECFVTILEGLEAEFKAAKMRVDALPFYGYLVYQCHCLQCQRTEWIFQDNTNFLLDLYDDSDSRDVKVELWKRVNEKSKAVKIEKIDNRLILQNRNVIASGFDIHKDMLYIDLEKEVNAPIGDSDTEKLIDRFFDFTVYSATKNSYQCDKCKGQSTYAYNKYYILKPPEILVICLKKFEKGLSGMKKYSKSVSFSPEIDLSRYVLVKSGQHVPKAQYELYGAVQHSGSLHGGHYVCYVKKESGNWYYISDSFFNKVNATAALNSDAYLLFYKLKE